MSITTSNQQIEQMLLSALDALTRNDIGPWPAMFTEDGVMEFPFAPPGYPKRVEGKQNLVTYLAGYPEIIKLDRINPATFHHSENVTVAEFSVEGKAVQTGNSYHQQYISVIEHRAGQITRYVDYWNPLVAIEALGGADALLNFGKKGA